MRRQGWWHVLEAAVFVAGVSWMTVGVHWMEIGY